jgi:energy-converting hydrogenase B subunit O
LIDISDPETLASILIATFGIPMIGILFATILPGIERKIQARIQQRIGPGILTPGFFAIFKFAFKHKPQIVSPMPTLYKWSPFIGILAIYGVVVFSTPQWTDILGLGSLVAIIGLIKIEEFVYVIMGYLSSNILSVRLPYHDTIKGSKFREASRMTIENWGSVRMWKMIMLASLPLYVAMFIPVAFTHSISISEIVSSQSGGNPFFLTVPGLIGAAIYFLGYVAVLNEYPYSIGKAKADVIEGPMMELASSWRASYYLMRAFVMFAISSLFVTLYFGVPLNPFNGVVLLIHFLLVLILPVAMSVFSAFSPILTFRQLVPLSTVATLVGFFVFIITIGVAS